MTQKVMNEIFCGKIEINTQNFNQINENDLGIRLYKIELSKYHELVPFMIKYLIPAENNRANRYHFSKDKNRFIICRTVLKFILAEHLDLQIENIVLNLDANKKPYLPSHPSIFFNVSHAGDYALIAIANSSLGVDIEYVNKDFDYEEILPNIFNKSEIAEIINSKDKHQEFYRLWTRKEAIVKATGKGLDDHILEVPSLDGYHHILSEITGNIKTMKVFSFKLNDDYVGAIALSEVSEQINNLLFYPIPLKFQELQ